MDGGDCFAGGSVGQAQDGDAAAVDGFGAARGVLAVGFGQCHQLQVGAAVEALVDLPNIIITPHVAGWSPEATQASVAQFIANMNGVFAGTGAVAPVHLG